MAVAGILNWRHLTRAVRMGRQMRQADPEYLELLTALLH